MGQECDMVLSDITSSVCGRIELCKDICRCECEMDKKGWLRAPGPVLDKQDNSPVCSLL